MTATGGGMIRNIVSMPRKISFLYRTFLIQRQVWEKENSILRDRISVMGDLGLSEEEIRRLVWTNVSSPLIELGSHQDNRMIEDAE
ncbi:MAG: hypothetical protein IH914_08335 [candidate division Zixibacteria bacterium]|nr:hypothetical protein [candidate division Zixibacteria bacterium]